MTFANDFKNTECETKPVLVLEDAVDADAPAVLLHTLQGTPISLGESCPSRMLEHPIWGL